MDALSAAFEQMGKELTDEAMQGALQERERRRAARKAQRKPQLFGPQTGGSNMQVGPHVHKNKLKNMKKDTFIIHLIY